MFDSISEDFLHFVWQTLNFNLGGLLTTCEKKVEIRKNGEWNHNQGPDFLHACILIDDMEWHGQVELHIKSEDWYKHRHHEDPYYNNTILHVVLEEGKREILREDGSRIPELALNGRILPKVLDKYDQLRLNQRKIPCSFALPDLPERYIYPWIERMLIERLEEKADRIKQRLAEKISDWEQVLWEELAAMMGGPVNQDAMRQMAQYIPYKILKKHTTDTTQVEALLFGVSGMLNGSTTYDEYYLDLKKEWAFLQHKYKLTCSPMHLKYLRMRPAAFPSIRLAQMAALLTTFHPLIDLIESEGFQQFLKSSIQASSYWSTNFRFGGKGSKNQIKRLGKNQKEVLIINSLLPLAILYHRAYGRTDIHGLIERSLSQLAPEHNRHTKHFEGLGLRNENAMHSQGFIQLKKKYCDQKRCLKCGIGHQVMKST